MKKFLGDDFQLENETAVYLYEKYAKNMPIFDYHCHLVPKDIYIDRKFKDLTEVWLVDGNYGDHYKWRAMRANGVSEDYITGNKSNEEKFMEWAKTVPYTIGNPLYHWVHMELKNFFGIEKLLSEKTAKEIYEECNKKLETLTARKMIEMSNVKVLCTTDDPVDSLEWHIKLKLDGDFKVKVLPAFRPDKCVNIDQNSYIPWIKTLESVVKFEILSLDDLETALVSRMDFFHEVGCRISDHALDEVSYIEATKEEIDLILKKKLNGENLSLVDEEKYKTYMVLFFGREYAKRNWSQQYHINAMRNNSKRMMAKIGPDTGFDSINDSNFAPKLSKLLNNLDSTDELPRTILYSLNPKDNETIATIGTCFYGSMPSKIQFGSAWWFNDQKTGMQEQMKTLANMGLISRFVGMLTDSRSFLSYPRHEYFRRLLCNFFGTLIENGEYPNDLEFVGQIVEDICFNNAYKYFNIGE